MFFHDEARVELVRVHLPGLHGMEDASLSEESDADALGLGGVGEQGLGLLSEVDEDFDDTAVDEDAEVNVAADVVFSGSNRHAERDHHVRELVGAVPEDANSALQGAVCVEEFC